MKTKFIAIVAAIVCAFGIFAGCTATTTESTESTIVAETTVEEDATVDAANEDISETEVELNEAESEVSE